jgi:hypothetical protein
LLNSKVNPNYIKLLKLHIDSNYNNINIYSNQYSYNDNKITIIKCNHCHKYIGHLNCVFNYIKNKNYNNIICFICKK